MTPTPNWKRGCAAGNGNNGDQVGQERQPERRCVPVRTVAFKFLRLASPSSSRPEPRLESLGQLVL